MIFNNSENIAEKLNIDLNLRPQNLNLETYYKIAEEFEKLGLSQVSFFPCKIPFPNFDK